MQRAWTRSWRFPLWIPRKPTQSLWQEWTTSNRWFSPLLCHSYPTSLYLFIDIAQIILRYFLFYIFYLLLFQMNFISIFMNLYRNLFPFIRLFHPEHQIVGWKIDFYEKWDNWNEEVTWGSNLNYRGRAAGLSFKFLLCCTPFILLWLPLLPCICSLCCCRTHWHSSELTLTYKQNYLSVLNMASVRSNSFLVLAVISTH